MDHAIQPLLAQLAAGAHLTQDQSARAFQILMNGGATPAQMGAMLMALRQKGETVEEISGAAQALRAKMQKIIAPAQAIDTCGTGGDGKNTLNISTGVAILTAACGVPVAKHGNRAVSSQSGSADVLAELGVQIDAVPEAAERCLQSCAITFLLAPCYHPAMRHVAPVRQELGMRTIFNLLGPLINPAQPQRQLLGVYAKEWVEKMARVLQALGSQRAWVVHGSDGMDELTLGGISYVTELSEGRLRSFEVRPEDAGLSVLSAEALRGGDIRRNAQALRQLLLGERGAYREAVLLNTAAALVIAQKAAHLREGAEMAAAALDEGKALSLLHRWIECSHG